jgi:CDP-glucose 4,6-dehydratase
VLRSDGTLIRDYLYVEDAAEAYIGLAERAHEPGIAGQAWNYSNELQLTAADMTRRVLAACGRADLELDIRGEAVHEIAHQYLSAAKARERLGWAPAHGLDEGLRRTVAWYRRHLTREIGCAA